MGHGVAQFPEQCGEMPLLVGLSTVVGRLVPARNVGYHRWFGCGAISGPLFSLDYELNRVDVLAGLLTHLKVGAGAKRLSLEVHYVGAAARLRRNLVT